MALALRRGYRARAGRMKAESRESALAWVAGLNAARDREIEKSGVGPARRPERGCCSLCFGSKRAPERDPLVQY